MIELNVKGMGARYYPDYEQVIDDEVIVIHTKVTETSALFYYITKSTELRYGYYQPEENTFDVVQEEVSFLQGGHPLHIHQEKTNMDKLFTEIDGIEKARETMMSCIRARSQSGNYPSASEQQEEFDHARSPSPKV